MEGLVPLYLDIINSFLETYKKASQFHFNRIRFDKSIHEIELFPGYTLHDFCGEKAHRTPGLLLRGLVRYPYIDADTEVVNRYIQNKFFITKGGRRQDVYGFAVAYLYSTLCIGYRSEPFWDDFRYELIIDDGFSATTAIVGCLSKPEHTDHPHFRVWLETRADVLLEESNIAVEEKQIRLRDDHGKDVLTDFAKKIVRSKYVTAVINSLPFNPQSKQFVRAVHGDGKIEIVLIWTDPGYGMVIQTTGRNLAEARKIADILTDEHS